MKRFKLQMALMTVFLVSAVNAVAHPKDSDSLDYLGYGSTITLNDDVNIPATRYVDRFVFDHPVEVRSNRYYNPYFNAKVSCYLFLKDQQEYDRIIPKGTSFKIVDVKKTVGGTNILDHGPEFFSYKILLNTTDDPNSKVDHFECEIDGPFVFTYTERFNANVYEYGELTIGMFKAITNGYLTLSLAEPVVIR